MRLDWDDTGQPVLRAPDGAPARTDDDVRAALGEVRRKLRIVAAKLPRPSGPST